MEGNGTGNLEILGIDGKKQNWKEPGNIKNRDGKKWNWKKPENLRNSWKEMELDLTCKYEKYFIYKKREMTIVTSILTRR